MSLCCAREGTRTNLEKIVESLSLHGTDSHALPIHLSTRGALDI